VSVIGGVAAACIVAALVISGVDRAFAESEAGADEIGIPRPTTPPNVWDDSAFSPSGEASSQRYLLFGGLDLWRNGGFLHGGMLWSPAGLGHEGFTLKLLFGGGVYRYRSGGAEITGDTALAAAMPGWRFKYDRLEITAVAGLDLQAHHLAPADPGNRMRGSHAGLRAGADLWYQPSDAMMVNGGVSVSTIGPNYWTRGALGWRLLDYAWAGPEVLALGGSNYQQWRLGLHATAFKTNALEWSAGLGYVRDSDHRNGVYGRIGVLTRR
jgi:Cellulose biosynthesis protein BcsS